MQNAKDTFYEAMRTRLATVNPERTVVLRGVTRPAVLVEENELLTAELLLDCFRLRWTGASVDHKGAMPLVTLSCEVMYATAGTALNGGMDRGRVLGAMDAELAAMVNACPQRVAKTNYAGLAYDEAAVAISTNVWWSDVVFARAKVKNEWVERTAVVTVMSYEEAGEL